MELNLKSDFRDYYDFMFAKDNINCKTLLRMAKTSRSRWEDYKILNSYGLITPVLAKGKETFVEQISMRHEHPGGGADMDGRHVVVYDDITAHRGEGKRLVEWQDAPEDAWIGEYITPVVSGRFGGQSQDTWRYLFIGDRVYSLKYSNPNSDWRSNVGDDIDIKLISAISRPSATLIREPLLAIDMIQRGGTWYAIDYNDAPGVGGTPVEEMYSASVIMDQLCKWVYGSNSIVPIIQPGDVVKYLDSKGRDKTVNTYKGLNGKVLMSNSGIAYHDWLQENVVPLFITRNDVEIWRRKQ
jgi:hypothetical protein